MRRGESEWTNLASCDFAKNAFQNVYNIFVKLFYASSADAELGQAFSTSKGDAVPECTQPPDPLSYARNLISK